ncbi:MAG: cell filamentation protein Fic, partial [Terrisporobacter sp.]|uniref:hypothetical protein n=1 Tax=Terrisporobacter sp. TaxID=1965305 RepID=UPI003A9FD0FA
NYLKSIHKFIFGEINAIYPLREGNGRTQIMFMERLALKNGFSLDFAKITNEEMLEASVQTFNLEYDFMSKLLLRALSINE